MLSDILIQFAKEHPWLIFFNVLFMLFVPINEVLLPNAYGKMITNISTGDFLRCLITIIVLLAIVQVGFLMRDKLNERFVPTLESFIKRQIIDTLLKNHNLGALVGPKESAELTTGDIIYKITRIPDIIIYWFQWINDYIIPYIFVFITATVFFAKYDKVFALIFVIFVIAVCIVFYSTPKVCLNYSKKTDDEISSMHERIEDLIHNIPSIFTANKQSDEMKRIDDQGHSYLAMFSKTAQCTRSFKIVLLPFTLVLIATFIIRSKILLGKGEIKKAQFTSMFVILTSMMATMFWLIDIIRNGALDAGIFANMNSMMVLPENIPTRNKMPYEPPNNVIGLRNINCKYNGSTVFENLNIDFAPGKKTALIGPVGCGKSTIFKLLLGFITPENGDAYLMGKWYNDWNNIHEIRERVGYVAQNPVLFNETVMYNIKYGNDNVDDTIILRLLQEFGYDESFAFKNVGKNGMNLSGGQRQLVWCMRIIIKNPDIVLMDEPTASMDNDNKNVLMNVFDKMMNGKTVIMITHDDYLLKYADIQINVGKITNKS